MNEDQITELAKKGIEESFEVAKEFAGKLLNPGLDAGGGIIGDTVKGWRVVNQVKVVLKTAERIKKLGVEPGLVMPKTLLPLLESASLEEGEFMRNKWSALLASAANPETANLVRPSFVEILKELSPNEAKLLDAIFKLVESGTLPRKEWPYRGATRESIMKSQNLDTLTFELAIDNLFRLQLCRPPAVKLDFIAPKDRYFALQMKHIICITELGYTFVKVCEWEEEDAK